MTMFVEASDAFPYLGGNKMITKPRGTYDVLPEESKKWVKLENYLRRVASLYNFKEVRL